MEQYLQTYVEPFNTNGATTSTSSSSVPTASAPLVTTTTTADQVTLPLTQGSLTTNLGIPIAIVCCKASQITIAYSLIDDILILGVIHRVILSTIMNIPKTIKKSNLTSYNRRCEPFV